MTLAEARNRLARANRMIANEGVLDAFGHVTMRHPTDPTRYLMSVSRAPELVMPDDIHEFTLDSQIVKPIEPRLYGERVIHGEIYRCHDIARISALFKRFELLIPQLHQKLSCRAHVLNNKVVSGHMR